MLKNYFLCSRVVFFVDLYQILKEYTTQLALYEIFWKKWELKSKSTIYLLFSPFSFSSRKKFVYKAYFVWCVRVCVCVQCIWWRLERGECGKHQAIETSIQIDVITQEMGCAHILPWLNIIIECNFGEKSNFTKCNISICKWAKVQHNYNQTKAKKDVTYTQYS